MNTQQHSPPLQARPGPLLALLTAGILAGCAQRVGVRVDVDGAYTPGIARSAGFANILVVGVSPDANQRCGFEQAMASNLRSATVKATMSCEVMGTTEQITRENVEKAVARLGADAVLATTLVASSGKLKEGGSADARGGGYYKATGYGYASGYYGAYGVPVVYGEFETAPSVFSISGTVQISTRLFETSGAALVYTLDTRAKNLASRELALAEITPAIAERLQKDGLVR